MTKSSNLARYYAGICYLNLGDYQNAIEYLNKFKTEDMLIGSAKFSSLGDAYSEQGDYESAAKEYLLGAEKFKNNFSTPILLKKAGLAYEEVQNFDKSLEIYTKILNDYPATPEGKEIDKFIERVKGKMSK